MGEEVDQLLPIANVGRIMRQALPPPAKISKEAKERMQDCATEFISFVTGEASDKCQKENRKTVNGDDIIWALSSLGFDNYTEVITRYLHHYREYEKEKAKRKELGFAAHEGTSAEARIEEQVEGGRRHPFEFMMLEKGN